MAWANSELCKRSTQLHIHTLQMSLLYSQVLCLINYTTMGLCVYVDYMLPKEGWIIDAPCVWQGEKSEAGPDPPSRYPCFWNNTPCCQACLSTRQRGSCGATPSENKGISASWGGDRVGEMEPQAPHVGGPRATHCLNLAPL